MQEQGESLNLLAQLITERTGNYIRRVTCSSIGQQVCLANHFLGGEEGSESTNEYSILPFILQLGPRKPQEAEQQQQQPPPFSAPPPPFRARPPGEAPLLPPQLPPGHAAVALSRSSDEIPPGLSRNELSSLSLFSFRLLGQQLGSELCLEENGSF